MRGQLILIEGLDRSGKSTQAAILCEKLSRISNSQLIKFPDRSTPIGRLINEYLTNKTDLNDRSIHLLFQANRWELQAEILKLLNQGYFIVLDRYFYSGLAYSLASKKNIDFDWLYAAEKGLPQPDLTVFLSLSMEVIKARAGFGDERYENVEFQATVKQKFLLVFEKKPKNVEVLEVDRDSIEDVEKKIWGVVVKRGTNVLTEADLGVIE